MIFRPASFSFCLNCCFCISFQKKIPFNFSNFIFSLFMLGLFFSAGLRLRKFQGYYTWSFYGLWMLKVFFFTLLTDLVLKRSLTLVLTSVFAYITSQNWVDMALTPSKLVTDIFLKLLWKRGTGLYILNSVMSPEACSL
ncbi:hypothetical protein KFK09_020573 [Dendrobium nobile]|uniref:Uncharacterized protein n=1 Tax=Dendrobium nobile TaxID=94219 RepID=A0A8T3AML5_DENNO|nr:hypothetical protein KFK09_020573 [Dendrobium nobile]